jgi:hypothetical protein
MPAAKITKPDKAQVKPYEAGKWNAQDATDHKRAINDHAERLDELTDENGLVLRAALPAYIQADADDLLKLLLSQLDARYELAISLPIPEAPAAAVLDQDLLTGQFQFPAGTTLDQLEIDVTPSVS